MKPELIRLILRPLPDEVPVEIRLRRLLKSLLRAYGFRCESVETIPDETPTPKE